MWGGWSQLQAQGISRMRVRVESALCPEKCLELGGGVESALCPEKCLECEGGWSQSMPVERLECGVGWTQLYAQGMSKTVGEWLSLLMPGKCRKFGGSVESALCPRNVYNAGEGGVSSMQREMSRMRGGPQEMSRIWGRRVESALCPGNI